MVKKPSPLSKDFPINKYNYSAWNKFSTNPFMFKVNVINGEYFNVAGSVSGVLGNAVHEALNIYFGGNQDFPTSADPGMAMAEALNYGMEFIKNYNEAFIQYSSTIPNKEKLQEKFAFCFGNFMKDGGYNDGREVIFSEKKIEHTVEVNGKLLPIPLNGKIDLVYRDKQGRIIIEDHKTCYNFSDNEKIDGAKLVQAVFYFFLVYAELGEKPYAIKYNECRYAQNKDGSSQVRPYVMPYDELPLAFELFYRLYDDITDALLGKQVYIPNFNALFDNEVAIISYINRLDIEETREQEFKKLKVDNISDFVKKKIQKAGSMKKFLEQVEKQFISGSAINYSDMKIEDKIKTKLAEHGIAVDFHSKIVGNTVTLYQYEPSIGLKMTRLEGFVKDIEQVVEKAGVRVLAPIPNTGFIGFEVPNLHRTFPMLQPNEGFNLAIGETIMGETRRFDIRQSPHMLVAGATGSGKSVFLNNLIKQLITIENVQMVFMDPKIVELAEWKNHGEYYNSPREISLKLMNLTKEMDKRYKDMGEKGVKNIEQMPEMPYIFVIIDEYADLNLTATVESKVMRLAQKGRACGIHLILATQRASTKVISGDVKINFPTRAVFRMAKEVDSRVMLDEGGAEKLLGKGDCLFLADNGIERLQTYS